MGTHGGDSIHRWRRAQTLTTANTSACGDQSIAIIREDRALKSSSNIQYRDQPRQWRCGGDRDKPWVGAAPRALASKPLVPDRQEIRRRLASGYTLDEIPSTTSTGATPACFEPNRLLWHQDSALRLSRSSARSLRC